MAGKNKEQPNKNEFSIASRAFNRGLRASYLAEVQTDIRDNVARLTSQYGDDPIKFENAALAWEKETLNGIDDIELQTSVKNSIRAQSQKAYQSIADAKRERVLGEMLVTTNTEIDNLDKEAQGFGFTGDLENSADSVLNAWSIIDEQIASDLISPEEGQKKKIAIQKRAEVERSAGETWRKFQDQNSFDEALKFMEQKETPTNFTEQEWRDTKQRIETDLRQKLDREQLDEANGIKISEEYQSANYNDALGRLVLGDLTSGEVSNMVRTQQISGEQGVKLADKMGSRGRGIDSPPLKNQIERAIFEGRYKDAQNLVIDNWGVALTDPTAASYLGRLAEYGNPESVLNSPEAKRYKDHLKNMIGYKDAMSSFFDPTMQQRWDAAILEYEDLVSNGSNPRQAMFVIVNDFTTPEQRFESKRNSIVSDNKDDLNGDLVKLQKLYDNNQITKQQYDKEAKYILDDLIPAKQASQEWNKMINDKSVKAEQ